MGSWQGVFMVRWRMLGMLARALIKEGTFVAAWKSGGYCWVRMSPSSVFAYLGRVVPDWVEVSGL